MIITVKINTDSAIGKQLENELRRYPESVEFIEPTVVEEATPTAYATSTDRFEPVGEPVNTVSAAESAKLAFSRLGEKYNRTFDNKYTR